MEFGGLNHICFSVSDLDLSIRFYQNIFKAKLLVKGRKLAYLDLNGLWLALNVEEDIPRKEICQSCTHIAFSITEQEYDDKKELLISLNIHVLPGRERDERDKKSIYFTDPDGHKFEFHTGKLADRMEYYRNTKPHMVFFDS